MLGLESKRVHIDFGSCEGHLVADDGSGNLSVGSGMLSDRDYVIRVRYDMGVDRSGS